MKRGYGNRTELKLEDGSVPEEFLLFRAGLNPTRNGYAVLFDAKAASSCRAAYEAHGVELMVDLEHMSLDDSAPNWDPDARGWGALSIREDGSSWMAGVRWTPDGTLRLTEQRQRYTSPVFAWEPVNGDSSIRRPLRILNVALCAMPATDHVPALVAKEKDTMNLTMKSAIGAAKYASKLSTVLAPKEVLAKLAEGDSSGAIAGVDIGELATFLEITENPGSDPAGFIKSLLTKLEEISGRLRGDAPPTPPAETTEEKKPEESAAAAKMLLKLTGKTSLEDVALEVQDWRPIVLTHREASAKLAQDTKAIEATKRRALTARLVACKAETPATAWADEAKTEPAKHLAVLSLAELEARCVALEARAGGQGKLTPAIPQDGGAEGAPELSERELAICKQSNVTPEAYAAARKRFALPSST